MTKLERIARNYAETKEQATKREWSAYGDIRLESHLAGSQAMLALLEGWIEGTTEQDPSGELSDYGKGKQSGRDAVRQELRRKIQEMK